LLRDYEGGNDFFDVTSWFVNMPITKEDKFLIKNLFTSEGYNAKQLVR